MINGYRSRGSCRPWHAPAAGAGRFTAPAVPIRQAPVRGHAHRSGIRTVRGRG